MHSPTALLSPFPLCSLFPCCSWAVGLLDELPHGSVCISVLVSVDLWCYFSVVLLVCYALSWVVLLDELSHAVLLMLSLLLWIYFDVDLGWWFGIEIFAIVVGFE